MYVCVLCVYVSMCMHNVCVCVFVSRLLVFWIAMFYTQPLHTVATIKNMHASSPSDNSQPHSNNQQSLKLGLTNRVTTMTTNMEKITQHACDEA